MHATAAQSVHEADRHFQIGETRRMAGDAEGAIAAYRRATTADFSHLGAHNNAAGLLLGLGRSAEALPHLQAALQIAPAIAGLHFNLGMAQANCKRPLEAIAGYRRALQLDPAFANAHLNLGILLHATGKLDEAERHLADAARLSGQPALALANLGTMRKEQGRVTEALAACEQAVRADSGNLLGWSNLFANAAYVADQIEAGRLAVWRRLYDGVLQSGQRPAAPARADGDRLRIGYVSADFREHAVSYFFVPALANHDRRRFEIFCYDSTLRPDAVTERLRATDTVWRHCADLHTEQLAQHIEADRIDILIDLMGHTADNRLDLFALRPAPLQGSWLGWPDRTGLSAIDFRIVDRHIAETESDDQSNEPPHERALALAHTWLCYRPDPRAPAIANPPSAAGGPITFGSFNSVFKLGPAVVGAWSRLLAAVPKARLLIVGVPAGLAQARLRASFVEHGVDPARLEIVAPCPLDEYFAHLARTDVALDPFPFNGSTTSLHALWLGVPVVTLAGQSHAGRMGCSLLRNAGLQQLIAASEDEYVAIAAALASDGKARLKLRSGMRERLRGSPLMDETGFARALEDAYLAAWNTCAADLMPAVRRSG